MGVRIFEVLLYMENIASTDPPVLDCGQGHNKQIQWIVFFAWIEDQWYLSHVKTLPLNLRNFYQTWDTGYRIPAIIFQHLSLKAAPMGRGEVQTVCKGYQPTTKVMLAWTELNVDIHSKKHFPHCGSKNKSSLPYLLLHFVYLNGVSRCLLVARFSGSFSFCLRVSLAA